MHDPQIYNNPEGILSLATWLEREQGVYNDTITV